MKNLVFGGVTALTLMATGALAHEYTLGDLTIDHPIVFETAVTARAGGGYMVVTNNGAADDVLLEVRAEYPRVEVHETVDNDGVMRMQHLENGLVIPAGESVTLEPGGLHIMFMGLDGRPFEVGGEVPVTLVFERAGEIEVIFNVEARVQDAMDHGDMDHGDMDMEAGE